MGESADKEADAEAGGEALFKGDDPYVLFDRWYAEAGKSEVNDPDAMSLATVDGDGQPNVRMVLMKDVSDQGFVFYTNLESQKGEELASVPKAALCFHWKSLRRQIRVRGPVESVSDDEADSYFASRAKDSQIGAWASRQSRPLEGRFELERAVAKFAAKYALKTVERPAFWSGFRLRPVYIEFWRDRPFRLHDRLVFKRASPAEKAWTTCRLFP